MLISSVLTSIGISTPNPSVNFCGEPETPLVPEVPIPTREG